MSITGLPGQGPVRVGIPIADLSAGLFCALGILVALLEREKSKKGQYVATSLLQAQIFMLDFQGVALAHRRRGAASRPATIIRPAFRPACSRPPTATSTSPRPARRSGSGSAMPLGATELIAAPGISDRRRALEESRRAQRRHRASYTSSAPAPNGSICSTRRASPAGRSTPSTRSMPIRRSIISAWRSRCRRKVRSCAWPASRCRCRARRASWWRRRPTLGEHTDEVLAEFGFSAKEIAALRKAKAI